MIALEHPYPTELIDRWTLGDGRRVTVRPVLPQDAELEQRLVRGLSARSRYARFMSPIRELSPQWLERLTRIDYACHVALVAENFDDNGTARAVGEARYVVEAGGTAAEFAVLTADDWRRAGLAAGMLGMLIGHARRAGLQRLYGDVLRDNDAMLALARRLGFHSGGHPEDARLSRVRLALQPAVATHTACAAR
ncbi:MAG TPA: GNAT family N-acetyltransferase [Methylibium sp.]|nr:GNAT family N-acetyltransferase [Methylibium sp.]